MVGRFPVFMTSKSKLVIGSGGSGVSSTSTPSGETTIEASAPPSTPEPLAVAETWKGWDAGCGADRRSELERQVAELLVAGLEGHRGLGEERREAGGERPPPSSKVSVPLPVLITRTENLAGVPWPPVA